MFAKDLDAERFSSWRHPLKWYPLCPSQLAFKRARSRLSGSLPRIPQYYIPVQDVVIMLNRTIFRSDQALMVGVVRHTGMSQWSKKSRVASAIMRPDIFQKAIAFDGKKVWTMMSTSRATKRETREKGVSDNYVYVQSGLRLLKKY